MHKKGAGEKTYFSHKQKTLFSKKKKKKERKSKKENKQKTTYFYQVIRGNFECAYCIEMSSLTFVVRGQVICKYKYGYSLIYIIIPFLLHENLSGEMKAQLCPELSMIKTCSEIQNLGLQHTPGLLLSIWLETISSGRASAIRWGPVSCFLSCLAHAHKEFWVILPFHDKGRLPILIS